MVCAFAEDADVVFAVGVTDAVSDVGTAIPADVGTAALVNVDIAAPADADIAADIFDSVTKSSM